METQLDRIQELAANDPKMVFTSLYHLINIDLLRECHKALDGKKATGVDNVTKAEYEVNLEANLNNLVERLKNKSYKPQPSLRVYIPKANGKLRPLGMAAYEDKIVQSALKRVLEPYMSQSSVTICLDFDQTWDVMTQLKNLDGL